MVFNEEMAHFNERWLNTPQGYYLESREKGLILNLTTPQWGETVLEVGCGTGEHLLFFQKQGCYVSGLEPSPALLEVARKKLGDRAELRLGRAADLPFPDNEFDIVSLILSETFTEDWEIAIGEAIRVCRGRVFIGVLNILSLAALQLKWRGLFKPSLSETGRFSRIGELKGMVRRLLPGVRIQWGSVIFLPAGWYGFAIGLEEAIPTRHNPFGAFLGLSFPVHFNLRTVQDIIGDPFQIKQEEGQPAQGIVTVR